LLQLCKLHILRGFRFRGKGAKLLHASQNESNSGIKMTIEPPKGLKQALLRAYLGFDEEWYLGARVMEILDASI